MVEDPAQLHPQKQDAIHRAVLAGLLGNVGARVGGAEYAGVRGRKFHLFPGSSLYRRKPEWVMAAELVETARVYARTVAPVRPLWVERIAAHLVKRTVSDPHWQPRVGRVLAFERVTLQGLTLIANRRVHFGPLEPRLAREIFIHHALVLGEYETRAPYFLHNLELVSRIQTLEAKSRRRDVLVDPQARFAFYDARVPQRIYTADEFERWRAVAEKKDSHLLFMKREDLMLHPALGVTEDLYPDAIEVAGSSFPLQYLFEPGDRDDGITVTLPLAVLNQLPAEPFEWLVPGFRSELFAALIRTLPKAQRVKFVPIPEFASAAARQLIPAGRPLLGSLADFLGKRSGEPVRAGHFQPQLLPEHLRMSFRIVDAAGNEAARDRDFLALRRRMGLQARATFSMSSLAGFHRDGFTRWDFEDLPPSIEMRHDDTTLIGYPALVDAGDTVSIRLFDVPAVAGKAHRRGLRRLFMIQIGQELQYIGRTLPEIERSCDAYATTGPCEELRDDILLAVADRALFGDRPDREIRTRDAFAASAEVGWRRLASVVPEVTGPVSSALELFHSLKTELGGDFPPLWNDSVDDMRDQLAHLVCRGFVAATPFEHLVEMPRYIRGIQSRLRKLGNAGLTRDRQATFEVRPLWEQYKQIAARNLEQGVHDTALDLYRWAVEELRVSLFAQELGTLQPVSTVRLLRLWGAVKK